MSEDTTKDISQKYDTAPTIETVLERIDALAQEVRAGFAGVNQKLTVIEQRVDKLEQRFVEFEDRLDRVEATSYRTHAELVELKREVKDFLKQYKEPA